MKQSKKLIQTQRNIFIIVFVIYGVISALFTYGGWSWLPENMRTFDSETFWIVEAVERIFVPLKRPLYWDFMLGRPIGGIIYTIYPLLFLFVLPMLTTRKYLTIKKL